VKIKSSLDFSASSLRQGKDEGFRQEKWKRFLKYSKKKSSIKLVD